MTLPSPRPASAGTGDLPAEPLAGYIERVAHCNDESGFAVLRVRARGHRGEVTVVGTLPDATPGEWIETRGRWVVNPKYGRQFQADEIRRKPPDTLDGIEKYLGSGLVHGIGPVYARRLVERFGRDVFDVIERRSALLLEVEGIGPLRRDRIRAAWAEQKMVREIMSFLFSHGVSPARAYRIYKTYGDRSIELIRMDPYRLARDIRGIGFLGADRIAERLGIGRDSMLRAQAGIEYTLSELTAEGHCAWPLDALVVRVAETLDIAPDCARAALELDLKERRLVAREGPEGVPLVYLPALDAAEREVARRLRRLLPGEHPLPAGAAAAMLPWLESRMGFALADAQREALLMAMRAKVLVITGGPGVGKTTLIRAVALAARARRLRLALCAPTGRAAKRLSESTGAVAKTIHRLLAYDPATGGFVHHAGRPLDVDWVVVDETSMVDIVLAAHLLRAVPLRAALLLVGDVDQLPPVGPGMALRDIIESAAAPVCRLTHIFRQSTRSHIVDNAHRIRSGELPVAPRVGRNEKTDFYIVETDDPAEILDRVLRLVQERIPRHFRLDPIDDIQVLTPMQRGDLGARRLNEVLQAALNPSGPQVEKYGTIYRVGDKVMQIENNYARDVFNGDIGRIAEIRDDTREARVRFDDRSVVYSFAELDELALAYALTVHKSQGSEYPCVVIPLHTQHYVMLQRNLLYTAVTRGRRLVVLVGALRALAIAVRRADTGQRVTLLRQWLTAPVIPDSEGTLSEL